MKKIVPVLLLTACSLNVTPESIGGSRSDGTVQFMYEYGALRRPMVNWDIAASEAVQRCQDWGYQTATPFGAETRECYLQISDDNCTRYRAIRTFQCAE